MKFTLITLSAVLVTVLAGPAVLLNGGYLPSYPSYASAALLAPGAAQLVSPVAPVAPVAQVGPVAQVASVAPVASTLSDYSYAYGSSLTYQDRYLPAAAAVVNSAYTLPYNLPYAYAADYYYRK